MCGIAGFAGYKNTDLEMLARMNGQMIHRGPDDDGMISAKDSAICMRRLSIIDLNSGKQPIISANGENAIVFNGEIYNHRELREELICKGYKFSTSSDTEVILEAFQEWGSNALEKLRGMFCFAILNLQNGSLFIARDRLGVKPLYISNQNGGIVFASELKAIIQHSAVSRDIDYSSVDVFLDFRTVHGPNTMFKDVKKFPPGHYGIWKNGTLKIERYWSTSTTVTFQGTEVDAQECFNDIFDEAVSIRMLSERPVGVFLSGGLDSTAITTSILKQYESKLKTFSIGFGWEGDELSAARDVSQILNTNHQELIITPNDFHHLPKLVYCLDEPIGDPIILPMYMLSQMASDSITVAQSGEGADELLGGYLMHRILLCLNYYQKMVPQWCHRTLTAPALQNAPLVFLEKLFDYPGSLGEKGRRRFIELLDLSYSGSANDQFRNIVRLFDVSDRRKIYSPSMSIFLRSQTIRTQETMSKNFNDTMSVLYEDWLPYISMQILDRITMSNSLEGRVPFTDHKLVEFCFSLPSSYKTSMFQNKKLLRNYLSKQGLGNFAKRKKKPFYIPFERFSSQSPLKEMLAELLSETSIKRRGIFDPTAIAELSIKQSSASTLDGKQLFSIAMLELWFRVYVDNEYGWL